MSNFYCATGLIGGEAGDLDAIDAVEESLEQDDAALVITEDMVYHYRLQDDSDVDAEDSPWVIEPTNATNQRWILVNSFGRSIIILTPQSSCGPSTNFATHDTIPGGSTPPEEVPVLDFDPDASEYRDFKFALPSGYAGGGLDITIYFSMTSDHDEGTPHKVRWEVAIRRVAADADDINAAHTYDYNGISVTVPSVVGEIVLAHVLFSDGADMDSLITSEMGILRIRRKHDHADDIATGDAELQMITIKEN